MSSSVAFPVGSADSDILHERTLAKAKHPALHEELHLRFMSEVRENDKIFMCLCLLCQRRSSRSVRTAFARPSSSH